MEERRRKGKEREARKRRENARSCALKFLNHGYVTAKLSEIFGHVTYVTR